MLTTGVARNAPCPCGRGRKFKHCCGAGRQPSVRGDGDPQVRVAELLREGNRWLLAGVPGSARACFDLAVTLAPDRPETWASLGTAHEAAGDVDQAVSAYRQALDLSPRFAEVHNNLGLVFRAQGRLDEAAASFEQALANKPGYAEAHFNFGLTLLAQGRHAEAASSYRAGLAHQPGNAQARSNLGVALEACGDLEAAVAAWREAARQDPDLVAARSRLANALGRLVPSWHVPMMNDAARNEAYHQALARLIEPTTTVFEVGTGSGLLAMMAARLGAARVTTCEAEPLIAATARTIIAVNGLEERVRVLAQPSADVEAERDLKGRADLLVSEVFSSELLGERVLASIEDARRRLLKPGGRIVPVAGSIMVALFGGDELGLNLRVDRVMGFDLSGFNAILPQRQTVFRTDLPVRLLGDDVEAFRFDFERDPDWAPARRTLALKVREAGTCLGIVQWLRLEMTRGGPCFENHPSVRAPASSWTRCVYLLPRPTDVRPGQTLTVAAGHNRVCPWFNPVGVT